MTAEPATRVLWLAPMLRWVAYLVLVAAVAGAAYLALEQRQPDSAPSHLDVERFEVDHPASWEYHGFVAVFSFHSSLGYLTSGRFDPGAICTRSRNTYSCNFSGHPVEPGGVVVMFGQVGGIATEFSAWPGETQATIGGMPAFFSEANAGDILSLTWRVRRPGTQDHWYVIEAKLREPGTAETRRQVEAMMASLRFDPAPTILPTSGPEFDRGAREAAEQALNNLRTGTDSAAYACFAPEPDVPHSAEVEVLPQHGRLSQPLAVTCTTLVEADVDLWRVRFVVEWSATGNDPRRDVGDQHHRAGRQETDVWVPAEGEPGLTFSGDDLRRLLSALTSQDSAARLMPCASSVM